MTEDTLWQAGVAVVIAVIASSGFWAWVSKRDTTKHATTRLMMGLAYDKITYMGLRYIERGWITMDELEDFRKYFYEPYKSLGGNGVAERIMSEVDKLPFKSHSKYTEIIQAVKRGQEKEDDTNHQQRSSNSIQGSHSE